MYEYRKIEREMLHYSTFVAYESKKMFSIFIFSLNMIHNTD